jgi:[glutamine synthetase] adenylyltransferase / [glutamine synthetase]-adenylyl-L-tyrosine phosphorylase
MKRDTRWASQKAAATFHPPQVESALLQLQEAWPNTAPPLLDLIENFPLGEGALLHLLAASSVCVSRLVRDPETLLWLAQSDICAERRGPRRMLADLHAWSNDAIAADNFSWLRRWKGRQMTRIALRELADLAPLEETTLELSLVAEISLNRVFEYWNVELRQRFGSPEADFAILALGKLGGHELNHSSDVDLLFIYGEEGELTPRGTYHEWFNRLGKEILETFAAPDAEGALFRVDLRLRPEGSAGPLARSLASMENYYAGFGETWERLALIKARGICGSRELAYEFLREHQPFIYPRNPTPDLLGEIANIKKRIERDVVGHENLERDVKLGVGGIREIEFVVQALQFIHGARHTFLQETSTLEALKGLAELELIPQKEVVDLDRAYRFLRRTEHRLQIEAEQQTHTVPEDPDALRRLALSLGFASGALFSAALKKEMQNVRAIFERIISDKPRESDVVDLSIFSDEKRATKALSDLAKGTTASHVAPRTRQVFRKLRPFLLASLAKAVDPDATLNQFVRFVEAYGLRSLLFELLVTNPRLLDLLVKTFDASRFAGDLLIRRPDLLEDVTRDESIDASISLKEHLRRLRALHVSREALDPVRSYRQTQLLRTVLRDVLGIVDLTALCHELSDLTEACLLFLNHLLGGESLTIIALGKFGGRELTYGADLDVLFVGNDNDNRAAQNLMVAMAQASAEGNVAMLDARLRPDGEKGPLVPPLESYEAYYRQRAHLWEIHALTRARPVTGPLQQSYIDMVKEIWRDIGRQPDLFDKIDNMLMRIRRDRSSGADFLDFKTGEGGLIEAEFLVQALQMRAGIWNPNWRNALEALREDGVVSKDDATAVARSYEFLRRCESVLRRWEMKNLSTLPVNPEEQRKLERRLGFANTETFAKEYVDLRQTIHRLYDRHIKKAAG